MNREPTYHEAIMALCPNAEFVTYDNKAPITWHNMNGDSVPTEDQIQAKLTELKNTHTGNKYQRDRATTYPSIQDQLDMQYWDKKNGTTTWVDAVAKVKSDNPKPS